MSPDQHSIQIVADLFARAVQTPHLVVVLLREPPVLAKGVQSLFDKRILLLMP